MLDEKKLRRYAKRLPPPAPWLPLAGGLVLAALFVLALVLRLHHLGDALPRDGDEGVYWQTLRAMSRGDALYRDVFLSQPPFFMTGLHFFYALGGETLWAARLGVAIFSLAGIIGAFLLGRSLAGWRGATLAVALAALDPIYLAASQSLQAEAPQLGLSLLAVGAAYGCAETHNTALRVAAAALCGCALALSILVKLFGLAALVPVGLLLVMKLSIRASRADMVPRAIIGFAVFIATMAAVLLPFRESLSAMWQDAITFHLIAASVFAPQPDMTLMAVARFLVYSGTAYVAALGLAVAVSRWDWRAVPLIGWLLATLFLLWRQTPFFPHHLAALIPPLLGLGAFAAMMRRPVWCGRGAAAALGLLGVAALDFVQLHAYEAEQAALDATESAAIASVAAEIRGTIKSDRRLITDAPFIAALANRDPLPAMVDLSQVRLRSHSLTSSDLIHAAQEPNVQAVLFDSEANILAAQADFYAWVSQHYRLVRRFAPGRHELWLKG